MKRELYVNFLLVRYMFMTMDQVNSLEDHEKEYYVIEIEKYLDSEAPTEL